MVKMLSPVMCSSVFGCFLDASKAFDGVHRVIARVTSSFAPFGVLKSEGRQFSTSDNCIGNR